MSNVITLRNPQALLLPQTQDIISRAITANPYVAPGGINSIGPDLFYMVTDPKSFLMLGAEEGEFHGMITGNLPAGNFFPFPIVTLFYNDGSRDLKEHMKEELFDLLTTEGYTKAWAINASGRSDRAWLRTFAHDRVQMKIVGSIMELGVK